MNNPSPGTTLSVSPSAAERRRRVSRGWRRVLISLIVVVVLFAGVTARLFVWPAQGMPASVSAIVMLAGPGDRLPVALQLAQEHRAPVLVVSQGHEGWGGPCPSEKVAGVTIICFEPNPGNTRGEAEFAGRLAKQYHWRSIVLVTTLAQDTRARIILRRCFGGSIYVAGAPLPLHQWPGQLIYNWGALAKALILQRSC